MRGQEPTAHLALRPVNWCSRLLKMTVLVGVVLLGGSYLLSPHEPLVLVGEQIAVFQREHFYRDVAAVIGGLALFAALLIGFRKLYKRR